MRRAVLYRRSSVTALTSTCVAWWKKAANLCRIQKSATGRATGRVVTVIVRLLRYNKTVRRVCRSQSMRRTCRVRVSQCRSPVVQPPSFWNNSMTSGCVVSAKTAASLISGFGKFPTIGKYSHRQKSEDRVPKTQFPRQLNATVYLWGTIPKTIKCHVGHCHRGATSGCFVCRYSSRKLRA